MREKCAVCGGPKGDCHHLSVALAYARFDNVGGTSSDAIADLRWFDVVNHQLIGPLLRATSPSLGIIDSINQISGSFLETDADWVFWFDLDMGFAPETLFLLHQAASEGGHAAVSALTFKYQQTATDGLGGFLCEDRPVIMNWGQADNGDTGFMCRRNYPENTLIQCQATGMACVLIHRRVYEAIAEKFGPGGPFYPEHPVLAQILWGRNGGWHTPMPAPPGAAMDMLGPDISFWSRAAMCDPSFMPFVHTGVMTNHQKTTWRSHATYERHVGDEWRAETPGGEYVQPEPELKPNRAQRRAEKKKADLGLPEPFQMDTPGVGGVPLPK